MSTVSMKEQPQVDDAKKARRNIFEDPAIAEAGRNDPFVRFIASNWRTLLTVLIAAALGMIGYNRFTATALQKRADATKILRQIQEGYQSLIEKQDALAKAQESERSAADEAKKTAAAAQVKLEAEEVTRLKDKLGLMVAGLDAPPPFATLSQLYKGLIAARVGDFDTAQTVLASIDWEQAGKPGSQDRQVAELTSLALAKALIDSGSHRDSAKKTLTQLSERGEIAAPRAVDALASIASSPEEKEQVRGLIQAVQQRYPSQQKLLSAASERVAS